MKYKLYKLLFLPALIGLVFGGYLFLPKTARAAISYVQDNSGRGASPKAVAFGSNTTAGNLIVVGIVTESAVAVSTVADTQLNTYHSAGVTGVMNNSTWVEVWYAYNTAGGADTVTVTDASAATPDVSIVEYSGVATATDPFDTAVALTGGAAANPSVTLTTAQNNELLFGVVGSPSASDSAGSGFTARTSTGSGANIFWLPEDSSGNTNTAGSNVVGFTTTSFFNGMVGAAFKGPAAAAGTVNNGVTLQNGSTTLKNGSITIRGY